MQPRVSLLDDQRQELLLHQRIEPAGRLVEDQQLRRVKAGEDQADLLPVPPRELAERAIEIGTKALGQGLGAAEALDSPQAGEEPDRLAACCLLSVAEVTGEVAQASPDGDAIAVAVEAEDAGAAAARVKQVKQGADRRRLARPVGAEEAEDLSSLD